MSHPSDVDTENRSVLHRQQALPDGFVSYGSHAEQIAEFFVPDASPSHWAVGIHGGFWRPAYDRTHLRNSAADLAMRGILSVLIEYRRIPGEPRTMVEDVCDAVTALSTRTDLPGHPAHRPTVWGHSAGGHLALVAACRVPQTIGHVVALAPVADLAQAQQESLGHGAVDEFLGGAARDFATLDPARLSGATIPVTLIHGLQDSLVPARQSQRLATLWPDADLCLIQGAGHFEVIDPLTQTWATVRKAICEPKHVQGA